MLNNKYYGFLVCFLFLFSCKNNTNERPLPDVSNIPMNVEIGRSEVEIFDGDTTQLSQITKTLLEKYGDFTDIYLKVMLRVGSGNPSAEQALLGIMRSPELQALYDSTQLVYKDFSSLKNDFNKAFQYYRYHFPKRPIPKINTCVTGFEYGSFTIGDEQLCISLDMYLGENFTYYQGTFPKYIARTMNKQHLVSRSMMALINNMTGENTDGKRLIDHIIHNGKKLYLLDQIMPFAPDSIKLGYTEAQTKWCSENELNIWTFFLNENLLYSVEKLKFQKYVSDSPNSPNMPAEAPGRTGDWIGWQIVKKYMNENPQITLEQLATTKDAQLILNKAKYKPK